MALNLNNLPVNDRGEVWYGGQMVGQMPGGGGGGVSRADIAQAIMQQQGGGGFDIARGPDQGGPTGGGGGRQAIGNQGWSMQGNNIYDPSGALVSSAGLQQYGYVPGYSPQGGGPGVGTGPDPYHSPVGNFTARESINPLSED